eukprot:g54796.t1
MWGSLREQRLQKEQKQLVRLQEQHSVQAQIMRLTKGAPHCSSEEAGALLRRLHYGVPCLWSLLASVIPDQEVLALLLHCLPHLAATPADKIAAAAGAVLLGHGSGVGDVEVAGGVGSLVLDAIWVALIALRRFRTLEAASLELMSALMDHIKETNFASTEQVDLLSKLLLGFQHSPTLVENARDMLPVLLRAEASNTAKENKSSDRLLQSGKAALEATAEMETAETTADQPFLPDLLPSLPNAVFAVTSRFPMAKLAVASLQRMLAPFAVPTRLQLERLLSKHSWLQPNPLAFNPLAQISSQARTENVGGRESREASSWYEGEWDCKNAGESTVFQGCAAVLGRRVLGVYSHPAAVRSPALAGLHANPSVRIGELVLAKNERTIFFQMGRLTRARQDQVFFEPVLNGAGARWLSTQQLWRPQVPPPQARELLLSRAALGSSGTHADGENQHNERDSAREEKESQQGNRPVEGGADMKQGSGSDKTEKAPQGLQGSLVFIRPPSQGKKLFRLGTVLGIVAAPTNAEDLTSTELEPPVFSPPWLMVRLDEGSARAFPISQLLWARPLLAPNQGSFTSGTLSGYLFCDEEDKPVLEGVWHSLYDRSHAVGSVGLNFHVSEISTSVGGSGECLEAFSGRWCQGEAAYETWIGVRRLTTGGFGFGSFAPLSSAFPLSLQEAVRHSQSSQFVLLNGCDQAICLGGHKNLSLLPSRPWTLECWFMLTTLPKPGRRFTLLAKSDDGSDPALSKRTSPLPNNKGNKGGGAEDRPPNYVLSVYKGKEANSSTRVAFHFACKPVLPLGKPVGNTSSAQKGADASQGGLMLDSVCQASEGQWVHVAVTCDGVQATLFLDGQQVSERLVHELPASSEVQVSGPLYCGGRFVLGGAGGATDTSQAARKTTLSAGYEFVDLLAGSVAGVKLWQRARSAEEFWIHRGIPDPSKSSLDDALSSAVNLLAPDDWLVSHWPLQSLFQVIPDIGPAASHGHLFHTSSLRTHLGSLTRDHTPSSCWRSLASPRVFPSPSRSFLTSTSSHSSELPPALAEPQCGTMHTRVMHDWLLSGAASAMLESGAPTTASSWAPKAGQTRLHVQVQGGVGSVWHRRTVGVPGADWAAEARLGPRRLRDWRSDVRLRVGLPDPWPSALAYRAEVCLNLRQGPIWALGQTPTGQNQDAALPNGSLCIACTLQSRVAEGPWAVRVLVKARDAVGRFRLLAKGLTRVTAPLENGHPDIGRGATRDRPLIDTPFAAFKFEVKFLPGRKHATQKRSRLSRRRAKDRLEVWVQDKFVAATALHPVWSVLLGKGEMFETQGTKRAERVDRRRERFSREGHPSMEIQIEDEEEDDEDEDEDEDDDDEDDEEDDEDEDKDGNAGEEDIDDAKHGAADAESIEDGSRVFSGLSGCSLLCHASKRFSFSPAPIIIKDWTFAQAKARSSTVTSGNAQREEKDQKAEADERHSWRMVQAVALQVLEVESSFVAGEVSSEWLRERPNWRRRLLAARTVKELQAEVLLLSEAPQLLQRSSALQEVQAESQPSAAGPEWTQETYDQWRSSLMAATTLSQVILTLLVLLSLLPSHYFSADWVGDEKTQNSQNGRSSTETVKKSQQETGFRIVRDALIGIRAFCETRSAAALHARWSQVLRGWRRERHQELQSAGSEGREDAQQDLAGEAPDWWTCEEAVRKVKWADAATAGKWLLDSLPRLGGKDGGGDVLTIPSSLQRLFSYQHWTKQLLVPAFRRAHKRYASSSSSSVMGQQGMSNDASLPGQTLRDAGAHTALFTHPSQQELSPSPGFHTTSSVLPLNVPGRLFSFSSFPSPSSSSSWSGDLGCWETSRGLLLLEDAGPFLATRVRGDVGTRKGLFHGFMEPRLDPEVLDPAPGASHRSQLVYQFSGQYVQHNQRVGYPCWLQFGRAVFFGRSLGGKAAEWRGLRKDRTQRLEVGFAGLVNIGNACYQNCFLQALALTQAFRQGLLEVASGQMETTPETAANKKGETPKKAGRKQKGPSARKGTPQKDLVVADGKTDKQRKTEEAEVAVARELQLLLAQLWFGLDPVADPARLKSTLRPPYNRGRQQDAHQYAQYLLQHLAEANGLPQKLRELVPSVFGGQVGNVMRCRGCQHVRVRYEPFTDLGVPFPKKYDPVLELRVVQGSQPNLSPPHDFDRIDVNLNTGRVGLGNAVPYLFLCVRRAHATRTARARQESQAKSRAELEEAAQLSEQAKQVQAEQEEEVEEHPITDVRLACGEAGDSLEVPPGWEWIDGNPNLNPGGSGRFAQVRLMVRRERNGSPVTSLQVLSLSPDRPPGPVPAPAGYSALPTNLNGQDGTRQIYLCLKRGAYVRDVALLRAASLEQAKQCRPTGFFVCPSPLLVRAAQACQQTEASSEQEEEQLWLCYTSGGSKLPITNLSLQEVRNPQDPQGQQTGTAVGEGERLALEQSGHRLELCVRRGDGLPITQLQVFRAPAVPPQYGGFRSLSLAPAWPIRAADAKAGKQDDFQPRLDDAVFVMEDGHRLRFLPELAEPASQEMDMWLVEGGYGHKAGWIRGVLFRTEQAAPYAYWYGEEQEKTRGRHEGGRSEGEGDGDMSSRTYDDQQQSRGRKRSGSWQLEGLWKQNNYPHPCPAWLQLAEDGQTFRGTWVYGDTQGTWLGHNRQLHVGEEGKAGPILDVLAVRGQDPGPRGYRRLDKTPGGRAANLNARTRGHQLHLYVCHNAEHALSPPNSAVVDVEVLLSGIDALQPDQELVRLWNANRQEPGAELNTNDGNTGHEMHIAIRRAPLQEGKRVVLDLGVVWSQTEQPLLGHRLLMMTPCGLEADLNAGSDSGHQIHLSVLQGPFKPSPAPYTIPTKPSLEPPLCEQYTLIDSDAADKTFIWTPKITKKVRGRFVHGIYCRGQAWVRGILYRDEEVPSLSSSAPTSPASAPSTSLPSASASPYKLLGRYFFPGFPRFGGACEFTLDPALQVLTGRTYIRSSGGPWSGRKDTYAILAWQHDTGSLWKEGQEVFGAASPGHVLGSMARECFGAEVLEDVLCGHCNQKAQAEKYSCLVDPPRYLWLHVLRFSVDYAAGTIRKLTQNIQLSPVLRLPLPPSALRVHLKMPGQAADRGPGASDDKESRNGEAAVEEAEAVKTHKKSSSNKTPTRSGKKSSAKKKQDSKQKSPNEKKRKKKNKNGHVENHDQGDLEEGPVASHACFGDEVPPCVAKGQHGQEFYEYGLYAVVIHAGSTLDGGHYFTYARSSAASDDALRRENTQEAPWFRFDDRTVTPCSWTELTAATQASLTDTVYMLLYRRLLPHSDSLPRIPVSCLWRELTPLHPSLLPTLRRRAVEFQMERQVSPHFLLDQHARLRACLPSALALPDTDSNSRSCNLPASPIPLLLDNENEDVQTKIT